jgi:hypothetical protein
MDLLTILIILLVVAWAGGFGVFHVTMWAIHLLLAVALVLLIIRILRGRSVI